MCPERQDKHELVSQVIPVLTICVPPHMRRIWVGNATENYSRCRTKANVSHGVGGDLCVQRILGLK